MGKYGKGDTSWFTHDRFGMFIVWGLYSMAARHEWVRNFEQMSDDEYQKYFDLFNPKEWAKAAKAAGMTYFVITTKHHEGFCLWDSKWTDYKAPNTPIGKDLLREVVDAFRAEGLHVGFYYSLIDWHHPEYPPGPNYPNVANIDSKTMCETRDMKKYAEY
ncbi:MAG: alpha-L-fucosidase, partial [Victivallales bacterium]|nr:alpha-L-fucosidase [Victivallales bacterium]